MSPATCPRCGQHRTAFVLRGGDLVCLDCACTCELGPGPCEVCR